MQPNSLLKRERELRGWSQTRVAEEIGTTALNVGRWERGISMPYPHFREKLCGLFGKNARELGLLEGEVPAVESFAARQSAATSPSSVYDPALPMSPGGGLRLIGRDKLLAQMKRRLCDEAQPTFMALHGLPGVGKTALALELAYDPEVRTRFRDGILWAAPGINPDIVEILSRWGRVMGVNVDNQLEGAESWARAIRAAIGQRQMLLVVDDAWNAEEALAFQVGGPCCAYLVTTRYPNLAVQLAAAGVLAIPELAEQDGVALLARYAAEFVEHAPETALALVRSVGALPLALTLMGKYLSVQIYSGQPRRLQAAVGHLRDAQARLQLSEVRALAERHPSLASGTAPSIQSLISVSEQLLDERARAALHMLSLFSAKPNSFAEEAALEVCQTEVETLDRLCDAGLLESNGPGRYMLHQTISDYARMRLTDLGAVQRLVSYYVCFVEEHARDHLLLEKEISNILAALEIAFTEHCRAELVRGVCALVEFLHVRGLYGLAEKQLKRAYEAAQPLNDQPGLIRILLYLGSIENNRGNLDQAEAYLLEGLELARKIACDRQICDLLRAIGAVEVERGNAAQAEACFREGLELARKLDQSEQICRLLNGLGVLAAKRDDFTQAEGYFQEGLTLARQLNHDERIITYLNNLGEMACERGMYAQAEVYFQESLQQTCQLGYEALCGAAHIRLGDLALRRGQFALSHEYLEQAVTLLRRVGAYIWLNNALFCCGELAVAERDDKSAARYFQESLELAQRAGALETIVTLFVELAGVETRGGNFEQAENYLLEAHSLADELGRSSLLGLTRYAWGELHLQLRQFADAERDFTRTRALIAPEQCELQTLALYGLARVAYARRDLVAAHQHGEASLAHFTALGHYRAAEVKRWLERIKPLHP